MIEGGFTRELADPPGDQTITGLGFQPRAVLFMYLINGTKHAGWGMATGPNNQNMLYHSGVSQDYWAYAGENSAVIEIHPAPGEFLSGKLKSLDADGFTITWVHYGPTTGTVWIKFTAFK
jgi:hypothetical protein